jgi:transcriptional regulator with XRE-family HTH domain
MRTTIGETQLSGAVWNILLKYFCLVSINWRLFDTTFLYIAIADIRFIGVKPPSWRCRDRIVRLKLGRIFSTGSDAVELKNPNIRTVDIDKHVGAQMRRRRIMMGLTQQQLADLIGVTYQQAHKYERGINRISAGRLFEIAQVLGVPVNHFYEGLDTPEQPASSPRQRMSLELARNFALITNTRHQEALTYLARALASADLTEPERSA